MTKDTLQRAVMLGVVALSAAALVVSLATRSQVSSLQPTQLQRAETQAATAEEIADAGADAPHLLKVTVPGTLVPAPPATGGPYGLQATSGLMSWPDAATPGGWLPSFACDFTNAGSVTISADGFYSICGASWQMNEFVHANGNWVVTPSTGLAATCNASGTYGRTDPVLSVRYENIIPDFSAAQSIRVTMCWTSWSPGGSNGGLEAFSQNVWDAGACQWGSQQYLDFNHVSGNEALFIEAQSARGCSSWPFNSGDTYITTFGTGSACMRSTWASGIQAASVKEVVQGVTSPPASGWSSYGWVGQGNYLFVGAGGGSWNPTGTAGYSDPTWYSTGMGLYCTGANSVTFTYFSIESK
jgi:hypothetical protein